MIDVDLHATLTEGKRHFTLATRFVAEARVVALCGRSGAGKSLTLQAIAGLLRPERGHVRVDGNVLFESVRGIDLPPNQRGIGYLFQHYALFPHLSVRDNVAFGMTNWWRRRLSSDAADRVDALLSSFGLTELAASRPESLSGGQKQRVALARALASEPRILLLDEPFAALNPMLRDALRDQLRQVFDEWHIPVIMITHDIDDVIALADTAFVVEGGRVVREIDVKQGERRDGLTGMTTAFDTPVCAVASIPTSREQRLRALLQVPLQS